MAERKQNDEVDLRESSVYGHQPEPVDESDIATEATIERLEVIAGGAEDDQNIYDGKLGQAFDELSASTEEELDALKVNLLQDGGSRSTFDGTGILVDDIAEERIAKLTEVGPMQPDLGAKSVTPGRDDTSAILRRHYANSENADEEDQAVGSLDEPRDESVSDAAADAGSGD
jgi:N utilization substance protein A